MKEKIIKCPYCAGSGKQKFYSNRHVVCGKCKGTGKVEEIDVKPFLKSNIAPYYAYPSKNVRTTY